ncbi:unnamed protein product [Danaus chrysippus]|uniref:(African queen) hypothetical protein n=1 Tax=Danaus chrysippus TaxID=151541 RepID=A0A8J2QJW2_9NEOP|nr:unnamed protein product [Danaus chrysippus]
MAKLCWTVVCILASLELCTPLINELEPGKEWPKRQSVRQPQDEIVPDVTTVVSDTTVDLIDIPEDVRDEEEKIQTKAADAEESKVDYSGAQLWKVAADKNGVRILLGRLRRRNLISTWSGNQTYIDVLVKPDAVQNVTRIFKRENITFDVIIEDLQRRINEENPPLDENEIELQDRRARAYNFWRYRANRRLGVIKAFMGYSSLNLPMELWPYANWGHRMTWKQYHRLEDIHGFMDYLAKTYPKIVSVNSIGKSYEGRDLKVLRISDGKPSNKAVFIDGGIHAREWISPATVTYFINQIAENFDEESDDIRNIDWYFLPVVNPDGYEYTHIKDRLWRKNRKPALYGVRQCVGTDLNRNFGYRWGGKGSSSNPCSEIYRGARAFSEPESRAVSEFIKTSAANFSAYLTYHSYGQYLLYPWGYDNAVPPDHKELDLVGKNIAAAIEATGGSKYSVGSSSGLLYPASGGSDDWAKGQGIKYAYTIELSDTGRHGFVLPTTFIEPVARESLSGLRVLAAQLRKN